MGAGPPETANAALGRRSGPAAPATDILRFQAAITAVAQCPKPVIAAVHGYCIGGGVDLIAACDIRLASADAIFSVREAKVAIVADLGSLQRLPSIIGAGHVAELAFTGKDIDAERARAIGLVNDVAADAEGVMKAAYELADEIAANSPHRRPGDQGGAGRQRGPHRRRGAGLRRHLECGHARLRRPGRGDDGVHGAAAAHFTGR